MRKSHKDVWPLLDNQKVKEESLVDKLQREVDELKVMNRKLSSAIVSELFNSEYK